MYRQMQIYEVPPTVLSLCNDLLQNTKHVKTKQAFFDYFYFMFGIDAVMLFYTYVVKRSVSV